MTLFIGSYHADENRPGFQPFLIVEGIKYVFSFMQNLEQHMTSSYRRNGHEFSTQRSLILQAYHTRDIQGSSFQTFLYWIILLKLYAVGQLLTDAILDQSESLLGPDGKEVAKLPQVSRIFKI